MLQFGPGVHVTKAVRDLTVALQFDVTNRSCEAKRKFCPVLIMKFFI